MRVRGNDSVLAWKGQYASSMRQVSENMEVELDTEKKRIRVLIPILEMELEKKNGEDTRESDEQRDQ